MLTFTLTFLTKFWLYSQNLVSLYSERQKKAGIRQRTRATWMRRWRPWTSWPFAAPNTKTGHRLPGSSRRPNTATAYTGWRGLTRGPGLWRRNATVAKRCLGLTPSRSRTSFTRKYPWRAGKSWQTRWHRRYGRSTLPGRGPSVNVPRDHVGARVQSRWQGAECWEHSAAPAQRRHARRECLGKHFVGVPSLLCSSFVVWFLLSAVS